MAASPSRFGFLFLAHIVNFTMSKSEQKRPVLGGFSILFLAGIAAMLSSDSCPPTPPGCENTTCFTLVYDCAGSATSFPAGTNFTMYEWTCWLTTGIANPDSRTIQNTDANTVITKTVSGTEINFGFWTKNTKHEDSYSDLFRWRWGRNPTSPELDTITDATAQSWFNTEYTDYHLFGSDPPTDVQSNTRSAGGKICFSTHAPCDNSSPMYSGVVKFPDGKTCTLTDKHLSDIGITSGCVTLPIHIERPCSECN